MGEYFILKKCFLDKKNLEAISNQPARETLMLLWAVIVMEAMTDEADDFTLSVNVATQIVPEVIGSRTNIPLEIVKLGLSLFLQLGMVEQTDKQPAQINISALRQILAGTPLDKITDGELKKLGGQHGQRLALVCEIAAETWKRNKKEIRSPGGYLKVLCGSMKIPDWFTSSGSTTNFEDKGREQSRLKVQELWESLSEQQQQNYLLKAKHSIPESIRQTPLHPEMTEAIAREIAWNEHLFQWVRERL